MADTKTEWMPAGLDRFGHLEDKIVSLVEAFKTVRKENETLREENRRLREEVQTLQAGDSSVRENLAQLQREREELRERVEKALGMLASLEVK